MRLTTLALAALTAVPLAFAGEKVVDTKHRPTWCFSACDDTLSPIHFTDKNDSLGYYESKLASPLYIASVVGCMETYCKDHALVGWDYVLNYAKEQGVQAPGYTALLKQLPPLSSFEVIDTEVVMHNTSNLYAAPVLPNQVNFDHGRETEWTWDDEMIMHHAFGWALWLLLGLMVIVGVINRVLTAYVAHSHRNSVDAEAAGLSGAKPSSTFTTRAYTWYRANVSTPALLGYRHLQPWGWVSIPTRLQSIAIFIYVALNLIFTLVGYHVFPENMYYSEYPVNFQLWRYVADRTGIMAFYNLPLLWMLAGRNDFLIWLTGWTYQSCNIFHRWAARVAVVQSIIHSAAYTWLERDDPYSELWAQEYWRTGIFATVAMCLLLPLSLKPIRDKVYEVFLILHICLAVVVLVMLWYHVKIFDGSYNPWLYACIGVWAFDRLLRVGRIAVLSFRTLGQQNTVATMTGGSEGLVRMSVNSSIRLHPKPGSYYFLYSPRSIKPWENHPFTLGSWEQTEAGTTLHFLFAPQSGWTRSIQRRIAKVSDGVAPSTSMRVLLEGPYGHDHPVTSYENILLVAGGSGITAILPYVFALQNESGPRHARHVTVVWVVRNAHYAADVLARELAPKHTQGIDIQVHVSREEGATASDVIDGLPTDVAAEVESDDGSSSSPQESPAHDKPEGGKERDDSDSDGEGHLRIRSGRPVMDALVGRSVAQLVGAERLAVLGCGPAGMMDDLRRAVSTRYGSGEGQVSGSTIEYFEEAFMW